MTTQPETPEPRAVVAAETAGQPSALTDAPDGRIPTAQLLQIRRGSLEPEAIEQVAEAGKISSSYATISASLGLVGLFGGLFVVWALPISLAATVFAVLARRNAQRGLAVSIGLGTGLAGIACGLVWFAYYGGLFSA